MQNQPLEVFYKKTVYKHLVIFTGKHPCWSSLFNKAVGFPSEFMQYCKLKVRFAPPHFFLFSYKNGIF